MTGGISGAGSMISTEGGPYTCSLSNSYNANLTSYCGRQSFEATFEAWVWLRAVPSGYPANNWDFAGWTGCDTTRNTTFGVECAVHSGAFSLDERAPVAHFSDVANPSVSLVSIAARVANLTIPISFSSTDPTAHFQCGVNAGVGGTCTPGNFTFKEGENSFSVRAVDPSGRVSNVATANFIVDSPRARGRSTRRRRSSTSRPAPPTAAPRRRR